MWPTCKTDLLLCRHADQSHSKKTAAVSTSSATTETAILKTPHSCDAEEGDMTTDVGATEPRVERSSAPTSSAPAKTSVLDLSDALLLGKRFTSTTAADMGAPLREGLTSLVRTFETGGCT
jgi:hypothetical protein